MAFETASPRTMIAMAVCLVLALLCFCPALAAQTTSVIPSQPVSLGLPGMTQTQIWKVIISSKGDVVAWDFDSGAIYEFPADGTGMKVLVPKAPNVFGGEWSTGGIAFDAEDNLYVAYRWNAYYVKIPYDPVEKTWHVTVSSSTKWAYNAAPGSYWYSPMDIAFLPVDKYGKGQFVLTDEANNVIFQYTGSGQGNGTVIAANLKVRPIALAVDADGNIYFQEDMSQGGAVGTFRIPAGTYGLDSGARDGKLEASWPVCGPDALTLDADNQVIQSPCRVDNGLAKQMHGVSVDAAGNVYVSTQQDFTGGTGGLFEIPNLTTIKIGETDTAVRMPNAANQIMIAPISPQGSILVHPEGYLYVPVASNDFGGWNGMYELIKVYLGSAALPAAAVNQQGASASVFYAFNGSVTPDGFTLSQGGQDAVDFTNIGDGTCTTGTTYSAMQRCTVNVALHSQVVGATSGVLTMTSGGTPVASTDIHGVGQGPALSVITPAAEVAIRSGLAAPKQVATDRWGNFYVADAGAGKVLQYLQGSTNSTAATPIAGSFTAPTGVAVDPAGNVFVADSGKVFEVAASGGEALEVQTGLGANLSLAADGAGNIYVADPDNSRVVKIPNLASRLLTGAGIVTVGSDFTAPSAVAADGNGNVFVVDGATLYKVLPTGGKVPLTNELASPVALGVDASGGVYVAQSEGVLRIPTINGALDYTQSTTMALDVWMPAGIAIDPTGIVYVTDAETPGVLAFGTNGAVDFGFITMNGTGTQNATLFNIGNQDLVFGSSAFASAGGSGEFNVVAAGDHCSNATVIPGSTCAMSFTMTPTGSVGSRQNTGDIQSNALNGNVQVALFGVGSNSAPSTITSMTYTPAQPVYPENVTLSVSVAPESGQGTATGKVSLTFDNKPVRPATLQDGTAEFVLRRPNGGQHVIVATYQGDMNYASTSATLDPPLTVARATASVALTPPPTQNGVPDIYVLHHGGYNLQGRITSPAGSPTGTAVLMENGAPALNESGTEVGSAVLDANGNVIFNTGSLPLGKHTFTLSYNGDTNFLQSSSQQLTFNIVDPSLVITTTTPTLTVTGGTPGTASLIINPVATFNQKGVQLACVNVPQYSECTFDWTSLDFSRSEPIPVQVTISTNVPVNVGAVRNDPLPGSGVWWSSVAFALGMVGLGFGKKTRYNGRVLMIVCCLLIVSSVMVGLTACGNSSYTKTPPAPHVTTPSGTTVVSIVATRNGQTVSVPFALTVTVK
ncbi:MAG TPA: Ig-like domain repeat protein [Terriglobales bacterium]|nr:Ig-like domain repeat protein [Terriglobales bacterium]